MHPRPSMETFKPCFPSTRVCIACPSPVCEDNPTMAFTFTVNGKSQTVDVPGGHAAAVGDPGRPQPQRHQVRLRHRPVRRLHRAPRRPRRSARARRLSATPRTGRSRRSRGCRPTGRTRCRSRGRRSTCRSAATARPGQIMSAAALLARNAEADRRRHRHRDERQPLPLRHVSPHPRSDSPRGRHAAGPRTTETARAQAAAQE